MTTTDEPAHAVRVTASPDLDAVSATLTAAFHDDPVMAWAIPSGTDDRERYLGAFFRLTTRFLLDHGGLVAMSADYRAVLVWSGVGEEADASENEEFLDLLSSQTGPSGDRVRTLMAALDDHHPVGLPPHFHVLYAAVRPHARGDGIRRSLTGALRALRHREQIGAYGEASSLRSLRLWERLGGERIGAAIELPDGGPSLYPFFLPAPSSPDTL
ncbi:ribosomal protein S18 acetylase RimI-like enzyme [Rhodococcus sp. 27YEA15]|uniref:hypothetical protein n=1 Tax=Rhodococcus sp. 27YEA15 TaxID=3156259 RepID=UPI003C7B1E29